MSTCKLILLVLITCTFIFAGNEGTLTEIAHYEEAGVQSVDLGQDGTIFIAKGTDGLFAYQYIDSILTQIAYNYLATDIFKVKAGEDSLIFTLSDQGVDAFFFTGKAFIHKAHMNSTGIAMDVNLGNTVFLVEKYYGIRVFSFQGNNFIKTAETKAYEKTGYVSLDVTVTSDSTVFLANYWGGLKFFKYDEDSLIFLGREHEVEWGRWSVYGESGASGVAIIGDTAVIVTADLVNPYLYIYKNEEIIKKLGEQTNVGGYPKISTTYSEIFVYDDREIAHVNFTGSSLRFLEYIGEYKSEIHNVVCDTNGVIYSALGNDGLYVYESNGSEYVKTTQTTLLGHPVDIEIYNDSTLMVANGLSGIQAFKYKNKAFSRITFYSDVQTASDIEIHNNAICLANGNGLKIFEYNNNKLSLIAENNDYDARTLDISDNGVIFTGNLYGYHLCAYELFNDSLILKSAINVSDVADILAISNDTVLSINRYGSLKAYAYDGESLNYISSLSGTNASVVAQMDDGTLITGGAYDGLNAFDLKNGAFIKKAYYDYPGNFTDIEINNMGIIFASNTYTLRAFTFDGSFHQQADLASSLNGLEILDNILFFVDEEDGLFAAEYYVETNISDKPITTFKLSQNYPNPFNPITTIQFAVPEPQHVKLQIFDITGRLVETLVDGFKEAGNWDVKWNASNYSSGIYIYRLQYGDKHISRKMLLMK